jgi:hypothetical protein
VPGTTPSSEEKAAVEASAQGLPFRALLRVPEVGHIPVFALGVEAGRPASDVSLLLGFEPLPEVVNTNVCDAVLSGRYGPYALLACRDRRGRTAVYSRWLAFAEINAAEAFLRDFSRFGLNKIEQRSREKCSAKDDQLQTRAASGRYNLGPLEHRARLNRAREYIQLSEELEKLRDELVALRKLRAVLADAEGVVSVG